MIENIKSISNPLTIIAIFAALAEIAGTVALGVVDSSYQGTFIWFVMIFPVVLVVLFFITLNFNSRVLYAPSDFKDEGNFLKTLESSVNRSQLVKQYDELFNQVEQVRRQILEQAIQEIGAAGEREQARLAEIVDRNIAPVLQRLERGRESAEELAFGTASTRIRLSSNQTEMLAALYVHSRELSTKELSAILDISASQVLNTAGSLRKQGFVATQLSLFELEGDDPGASQTHGLTNRGRYFVRRYMNPATTLQLSARASAIGE